MKLQLQYSVLCVLVLGTILGIESRKLAHNFQPHVEDNNIRLKPLPRSNPAKETALASGSSPTANTSSTLTFTPQSHLKGITDLILYSTRKDAFESRTGLVLFGLITAVELFVGTTLFVTVTGAMILGLVLMVKFMSIGGLIMIG